VVKRGSRTGVRIEEGIMSIVRGNMTEKGIRQVGIRKWK